MNANITTKDEMWVYFWYEASKPNETKFGERWVVKGKDPVKDVWKRISGSLGVRKDLLKGKIQTNRQKGEIILEDCFNVSEYAAIKCKDRLKVHGRVDDFLREKYLSSSRKGSTGEVHKISAPVAVNIIRKAIIAAGQPLPAGALSTMQYTKAVEIKNAVKNGSKTVLAELCARFGKTMWSGALAVELEADLTIIASYVQTVFTSFENDLLRFSQFAKHVHVDTKKPNYQKEIDKAIKDGKKVVAYLSMCSSDNRQDHIDYLFGKKVSRLLIIDEGDFGAHQHKQADPLIEARKKDDVVIIMTGTNGDRAASKWAIDYYTSVIYPELLIQKKKTATKKNVIPKGLSHFDVDPKRDLLAPYVSFYQLDLSGPVRWAKSQSLTFFDDELPSWSKTLSNPERAKGFILRIAQALFEGKGHNDLNVDDIVLRAERVRASARRVCMMFVPANSRTENVEAFAGIIQSGLKGWTVMNISGSGNLFGRVTNKNCERQAKELIANSKDNILLVAAQMAQRSFSVPEITELYLAYDKGSEGATIQKMSRALTPNGMDPNKVGRIFSLSFDPNRDDKFDSIILETVINYKDANPKISAVDAMMTVLNTIDIFDCSKTGVVKIDKDRYLELAMARDSLSRVVGKVADLSQLDDEELKALADGNNEYFRQAKTKVVDIGKTRHAVAVKIGDGTGARTTEEEKLIAKAREVIVKIAENLDIFTLGTGSKTLKEGLTIVKKNAILKKGVEKFFNVSFNVIELLFDRQVLNDVLLELMYDKKR